MCEVNVVTKISNLNLKILEKKLLPSFFKIILSYLFNISILFRHLNDFQERKCHCPKKNPIPYTSISQISNIAPVLVSSGASYVVSTITYLAVCLHGISIILLGKSGSVVLSV